MLNYRITQLAMAPCPDAGFFGICRNEQNGTRISDRIPPTQARGPQYASGNTSKEITPARGQHDLGCSRGGTG